MVVKTIYIARHGYRSNWLPKGPYPPPPTGIDSDVPLAAHGINQAKQLARYIISINNQPELIFSSPFYRCVQTSEPIAKLLELPVFLEPGIGEWYKPDRKIIPIPADIHALQKLFSEELLSESWEGTGVTADSHGETEDMIFDRCVRFWPIFIKKIETDFPNVETILLVTHAASKISLGLSLLGKSSVRESIDGQGTFIRSGSCSIDKYELISSNKQKDYNGNSNNTGEEDEEEEDDEEEESIDMNILDFKNRKWKNTMNGNTEFLSKGEEMNWSFQSLFEAGSDADIKSRQQNTTATNVEIGFQPQSQKPQDDINETETVYVSLDIPSGDYRKSNKVDSDTVLQMSGLETKEPLFKIGDKIYEGKWKKLVGTELVFPDEATLNTKGKDEKDIEKEQLPVKEDENERHDEEEEEEEEEEEKDNVTSEKIYHVTDRLVLSNVKPM